MTDREQDRIRAQEERQRTLEERAEDVRRRPVGEEIDPDSIRQVPHLDEDGEVIDPEELDALRQET